MGNNFKPSEPNGFKICCHCKLEKPRTAFYNNKRYRDGKNILCSKCADESNRKYMDNDNVYRDEANWQIGKIRNYCEQHFPHCKTCGFGQSRGRRCGLSIYPYMWKLAACVKIKVVRDED